MLTIPRSFQRLETVPIFSPHTHSPYTTSQFTRWENPAMPNWRYTWWVSWVMCRRMVHIDKGIYMYWVRHVILTTVLGGPDQFIQLHMGVDKGGRSRILTSNNQCWDFRLNGTLPCVSHILVAWSTPPTYSAGDPFCFKIIVIMVHINRLYAFCFL